MRRLKWFVVMFGFTAFSVSSLPATTPSVVQDNTATDGEDVTIPSKPATEAEVLFGQGVIWNAGGFTGPGGATSAAGSTTNIIDAAAITIWCSPGPICWEINGNFFDYYWNVGAPPPTTVEPSSSTGLVRHDILKN